MRCWTRFNTYKYKRAYKDTVYPIPCLILVNTFNTGFWLRNMGGAYIHCHVRTVTHNNQNMKTYYPRRKYWHPRGRNTRVNDTCNCYVHPRWKWKRRSQCRGAPGIIVEMYGKKCVTPVYVFISLVGFCALTYLKVNYGKPPPLCDLWSTVREYQLRVYSSTPPDPALLYLGGFTWWCHSTVLHTKQTKHHL